jgi:hydrogenase nickel insertion protein HypA
VHEYSIVQNLLAQVDEQVRGHEGKRATRIVVAIESGHVDEQFIRDAFDMFKAETSARDADLVVTHASVELWCPECGAHWTGATSYSACPRCGGAGVLMTSTEEICLQSVEIEV